MKYTVFFIGIISSFYYNVNASDLVAVAETKREKQSELYKQSIVNRLKLSSDDSTRIFFWGRFDTLSLKSDEERAICAEYKKLQAQDTAAEEVDKVAQRKMEYEECVSFFFQYKDLIENKVVHFKSSPDYSPEAHEELKQFDAALNIQINATLPDYTNPNTVAAEKRKMKNAFFEALNIHAAPAERVDKTPKERDDLIKALHSTVGRIMTQSIYLGPIQFEHPTAVEQQKRTIGHLLEAAIQNGTFKP